MNDRRINLFRQRCFRVPVLLILALLAGLLSGCSRYNGEKYSITRRGNVTLYDGSSRSTRIIRNNVWSSAKFLSDILPPQSNRIEVYITDGPVPELLGDRDFLEHIFKRIEGNKNYDEKEQEKARLLATTDLRDLLKNPDVMQGRSMHLLPAANIVILRHDENYNAKLFLYACVSLMLYDNNPGYYLNPALTRDELTDLMIFKFMLSGFPSLYSRYFSKYPGRKPSASLYKMLAEIDIEYLEDIYNLDEAKFAAYPDEILVSNAEAPVYYAYFFKYLFSRSDEKRSVELVNALFMPSEDPSEEFRGIYREWKKQIARD